MESSSGKHRSSKHKDGTSSSSTRLPPTSFLFVVNEFVIDYEKDLAQDQWLNYVPPTMPSAYQNEYIGAVFRYQQGQVSIAPGYQWERSGGRVGTPGQICYVDEYDQAWYPPIYKTSSIFSCSPHLPIVVLQDDASLGSRQRIACRCRPSSSTSDEHLCWNLPHFGHKDGTGISYINAHCQGYTFVAGYHPSWMPSLVPGTFANTLPSSSIPRSQGLAGDLPLLIALMAFHSDVGYASRVFNSGMWDRKRWRGPAQVPHGYPKHEENPRGFLVQVCCDLAENQTEEQARARLEDLEWGPGSILVEG